MHLGRRNITSEKWNFACHRRSLSYSPASVVVPWEQNLEEFFGVSAKDFSHRKDEYNCQVAEQSGKAKSKEQKLHLELFVFLIFYICCLVYALNGKYFNMPPNKPKRAISISELPFGRREIPFECENIHWKIPAHI